ncbi:uncharacterized protein LOC133723308 [Rosa rugosa]|uniref:uncharacterized protein LOC133723308 n=1 Tax=Rosa rugosa TaxID=74645 RepID=UPI002B41096D|nr:uncharacterized protein LOC133723308 [Rosa rugosa]
MGKVAGNGEDEIVQSAYHIMVAEAEAFEENDHDHSEGEVDEAPPELEEVGASYCFIREVQYPKWIANIVPVKKKNGQLRVCVNFRDLNDACPKDDFPLPIIELMVDATTGHEALSFMDGSSGYNQIMMALEDEELTAFHTPKGIYCYKVMPFGLKNVGATYQRAMQKIFGDMLHKYVELDQSKIKAIQDKHEPRNLHELKSLQGRLAFIRRFISNLAGRCQPFSRLLKKDVPFVCHEACHKAFESIKKYLANPPVLGAPILGKPLILYIAAQERSLGALLAQENEEKKENVLYYLSRTLTGQELNYPPIEKICLALVFAIQKLRHYMQAYTVHLVARADPVKFVMLQPVLTGRMAIWALLLNQYEIIYILTKVVKGQALVDFLADHPIPADWEISNDLPDEEVFNTEVLPAWQMFFDRSSRADGVGAGVVFISPYINTPQRQILPYAFTLGELCSNNIAEYQALIMGLQTAAKMKISNLEVYGDSKLVVDQLLTIYEVKKEDLVPYFQLATQLLKGFDAVTLTYVPRKENQMADALANLAAALALSEDEIIHLPICQRWVVPTISELLHEDSNVVSVYVIDVDDWRYPLIDYLERNKLSDDPKQHSDIRRRVPRFFYYKETLYQRSFDGLLLRCLGKEEAAKAMEEDH